MLESVRHVRHVHKQLENLLKGNGIRRTDWPDGPALVPSKRFKLFINVANMSILSRMANMFTALHLQSYSVGLPTIVGVGVGCT